jgi:mRNA interferase HigB
LLPNWEHAILRKLRVFNRSTLVAFWKKHPDAEKPIRLWFSIASKARWGGPADVRRVFGTADFLAGNRVVFDIKGNSYRLVVQIKYAPLCVVFIRFVGTHAEYDRIVAGKV